MDHTFLVILLMSLLSSCHCRPLRSRQKKDSVTDSSAIRFSLNGQHFQFALLNRPEIQPTLPITVKFPIEEPETRTVTHFAMLNVSPKITTRIEAKPITVIPEKIEDSTSTWTKLKNLYKELGDVLQAHEKADRGRESPTSKIRVNALAGDTSVQLKINEDSNKGEALKKDAQPDSGPNTGDPNSLNVHVHAEPPVKMRTIIGYRKPSNNVDIDAIKKLLRLYSHGTSLPATQQDLPYELNTQRSLQQDVSIEDAVFLQRASKLLLKMWKRFKERKNKNKSQELESQNFHEDFSDTKLTNRYLYYPNG